MNQNISQKIEFSGNTITCDALKSYLDRYHKEITYSISQKEETIFSITIDGETYRYEPPIRLGHILDRLFKSLKDKNTKILHFNAGKLDTILNSFKDKDGKNNVVLTEKEVEILSYLHAHKGQIVTREELLKAVWNYAESVETHTVETHIYRLRQKIEKDPANPKIVMTAQDGYMVEDN
ncbi:MAG: hypothetical protein GC137_02760 [Alphaproteobacteria bacterium]|nr:hypothetical protein [Alphaproteobacteria bacterium]